MIEIQSNEVKADKDQTLIFIKEVIEKIANGFTKQYLPITDYLMNDNFYIQPIEFYDPKNKLPIPTQKVTITFKIPKNLNYEEVTFNIENENVHYSLFNSININYFENLLYKVINNKEKSAKTLLLHTNFESSRILNFNGEKVNLYTIDDEEDILSNNNCEFFNSQASEFKFLEIEKIVNCIKILWKTLSKNGTKDLITIEEFNLLFEYGKLSFSTENLNKLWKYVDVTKRGSINYVEFLTFCIDMIQCLRAYHIAKYKNNNNNYISTIIKNCVEIMNLHFKEYDFEGNQEISFENLKKSLLKENELFTRKEIEILLKQINPNKNFEFWKFDKILKILYVDNFNYNALMKEDKIYNYLITIFEKQDTLQTKKLHYKKMKYALLIENKLRLNKIQIMFILNFFNINEQPEIDYYKACLIIRDMISDLFSPEIQMQKLEFATPKYHKFENFEDCYNEYYKNVKNLFISYDKDYDHLLNMSEFKVFLDWLIPYIDDKEKEEIFHFTDTNKNLKISYSEFKQNFETLVNLTRIKNVFKTISEIIKDKEEIAVEEEALNKEKESKEKESKE